MKQIYIATNVHGQGVTVVTGFNGKDDLIAYADNILACTNTRANYSDSIATICDKLYDMGPGYGARHHARVSREEAIELIRGGAADRTWLF
jgi:hypothetical protein